MRDTSDMPKDLEDCQALILAQATALSEQASAIVSQAKTIDEYRRTLPKRPHTSK